jgi:ornithine cyclodeaminase
VRQIKSVVIVDHDVKKAKSFVKEMAGQGKIPHDIRVMTDPDNAARFADIICTATTSHEPVYSAKAILPGTHINGVGSYTLNMVENPPEIYIQASAFVDSREAALAEAGETVKAINRDMLKNEDLVEIGKVCLGEHPGRILDQEITFFKSVGIAVQDAIAAKLVLKNAVHNGLGKMITF